MGSSPAMHPGSESERPAESEGTSVQPAGRRPAQPPKERHTRHVQPACMVVAVRPGPGDSGNSVPSRSRSYQGVQRPSSGESTGRSDPTDPGRTPGLGGRSGASGVSAPIGSACRKSPTTTRPHRRSEPLGRGRKLEEKMRNLVSRAAPGVGRILRAPTAPRSSETARPSPPNSRSSGCEVRDSEL